MSDHGGAVKTFSLLIRGLDFVLNIESYLLGSFSYPSIY